MSLAKDLTITKDLERIYTDVLVKLIVDNLVFC